MEPVCLGARTDTNIFERVWKTLQVPSLGAAAQAQVAESSASNWRYAITSALHAAS
jgi:hypothetical protein